MKNIFVSKYKDEEIHVHDIYHGRGKFAELTLSQKYFLLSRLYEMIDSLPITAISVAIDKQLMNERLPNWNILIPHGPLLPSDSINILKRNMMLKMV